MPAVSGLSISATYPYFLPLLRVSVRAKVSPQRYFPSVSGKSDHSSSLVIDRHIRELMIQGYNKLANAYPPLCISKDEDGMTFESTDLGRVMAKYCLAFKTMETMGRILSAKTTMAEMIECLSEAEEFVDFKPRNDQKKVLAKSRRDVFALLSMHLFVTAPHQCYSSLRRQTRKQTSCATRSTRK
jgi:replicative superfamily II helicase